MANVQSHVAPKGRKSVAAKPIASKVMSAEDKQHADELKLQGAQDTTNTNDQAASDLPPEVIAQERREREERRAIQPDQAHAFVAQHLAAPVVPDGADPLHRTPEQVAAEFKQKMEEAAANVAKELGISDPNAVTQLLQGQAPQPPRPAKLTRNNITRPASGTLTGTVWDVADEISKSHPGTTPATIAEIKADSRIRGMNDHTIKTQYARWRAYHGVRGRVALPTPVQAQQPAPVWTVGFGPAGNFELPEGQEAPAAATEQSAAEQPAPAA